MKLKYKYIHFVKNIKQNPKTWIYNVRTNDDATLLGQVKYLGHWRQYAFFTEGELILEKTCLKDIAEFCIELNERQRLKRKK